MGYGGTKRELELLCGTVEGHSPLQAQPTEISNT